MRKILISAFVCMFSLNALAQAPEKMSYQAVVRDNANLLVADKVVGLRISILRGSVTGTSAYTETQSPRSNINGLVTLEIGAGTVVSGSFAGLNWSTGPYFIQTEIDPSGGSNYSILGVSQLVSVPYALYAKTSGSSPAAVADEINDATTTIAPSQNAVFDALALKAPLANPIFTGKVIVGASSAASSSALFEASSTSQGFLPPRMTRVQRNAIINPVAGLIVWCTNCGPAGEIQVNNGTSWTNLIGGQASSYVPEAPTNPVATAGNAQASVAFTASASNDGGAIMGYTVKSSPGSFTGTGTSSPIAVYGLTNLSYTFTVYATNAAGNSVPSVITAAVTPSAYVLSAGEVLSTTGRIWMDRNLGATRTATSSTDAESYGDLYQWGRRADGHQLRNSAAINTLSSIDQPTHGSFILISIFPYDWRSPQNLNLWQGVYGVNNPCPSGFRIPTKAEWIAERLSWISSNAAGAFASPLKLTMAGSRQQNGTLSGVGQTGSYWSSESTESLNYSFGLQISQFSSSPIGEMQRVNGFSVRCIRYE